MAAVAVAAIWFLTLSRCSSSRWLVAALAFTEYARIVGAIGAKVPWWTTLRLTLAGLRDGAVPLDRSGRKRSSSSA